MIKEKERKVGEQEERKDIVRDGRVASWERCEVSRQAEPVPRRVRERGGGGGMGFNVYKETCIFSSQVVSGVNAAR